MAADAEAAEGGGRVGIVIQARMGSSRYPGKVLQPIGDRPLLARLLERLASAEGVEEIIVATTNRAEDDAVAGLCSSMEIPVFRGSEEDVLDRYYQAARAHGLGAVIRVTGDCPLMDPRLVEDLVAEYRTGRWDYVSNSMPMRLPHGMETSLMSWNALERSWREARLPSEREHVTRFIRERPERFRIKALDYDGFDHRHLRVTVDHPEDLEVVAEVFAILERRGLFGHVEEIVAILEEFPGLAGKNAHVPFQEGLKRSLAADPEDAGQG